MPIASSGTTSNNYLYSGEQFDSNVGWYQLRASWYRQAVGRFTTRDPKEGASCTPLSYNAYIYAFDDPVDRIDPTGRGEATIEQGQLIGIGLLASAGIIAFQKQIACDFGIAASLVTGVAASQNLFYVKSVRFHRIRVQPR